jgi:hypothetical protein
MLKESIVIHKPPREVFEWLMHFVENYRAWHPDHISAHWTKGRNFEIGSILHTEEYIGDQKETIRFRTTWVITDRLIKYQLLFPHSLICSGGSFRFESQNGSTLFIATLSFRMSRILKVFFNKKFKAIRKHMREEGANLKQILEGAA